MKYRADIDGLRAIAVIAVVIFHFKHSALPYGYLGVDVFFVISGFLITRHIFDALRDGTFTLKNFYARRVRRLFPAYVAVVTASSVAAYLFFLPDELLPFVQSSLASLVFSSNIWFYTEAGYFDAHSDLKPLLHTWSLSVEEQFYIVFPLVMFALHRRTRGYIVVALTGLFFASLIMYLFAVFATHDLDLAFYMLPMRAWHLLIGAAMAVWLVRSRDDLRALPLNIVAGFGFILLIVPLVLPQSGVQSVIDLMAIKIDAKEAATLINIVITLGTTLLLYTGAVAVKGNIFRYVLGLAPFTFIGKISYSLYLWHWPIYVFANHYYMYDLPRGPRVAFVIVSFVVAYLSWRFIEQPVRKSPKRLREMWMIRAGVAACVMVAAFNVVMISRGGYTPIHEAAGVAQETSEHSVPGLANFTDEAGVVIGSALGADGAFRNARFILMGDSHAEVMITPMHALAVTNHKPGVFIYNRCLTPSAFTAGFSDREILDCGRQTDDFLALLETMPQIDTVFLAMRWLARTERWRDDHGVGDAFALRQTALLQLVRDIEARGRRVMIVKQTPFMKLKDDNALSIYWRLKMRGEDTDAILNPTRDFYAGKMQPIEQIFDAIAEQTSVKFIEPVDALCPSAPDAVCPIRDDGGSFYFDDDHLSAYGSMKLVPLFAPYFEGGHNGD